MILISLILTCLITVYIIQLIIVVIYFIDDDYSSRKKLLMDLIPLNFFIDAFKTKWRKLK